MLPSLTVNDFRYGPTTNREPRGYGGWRQAIGLQLANLIDLLGGKFRLRHAKSALLYHVLRILFACTEKEMFWIAAWRIVATMANNPVVGYRAANQLVRRSVRVGILESPISAWVFRGLPFPAFARAALVYLFPETASECASRPMPTAKLLGMSLDPSAPRIGLFRNGRGLTATTHAKAARVGAIAIVPPALVMVKKILQRFAFAPAALANCECRNLGEFAASTLAKAVRDFHKKHLLSRTVNALAEGAQPTIRGGHNYSVVRSNRQATASLSDFIIPRLQEVGACQLRKVGGS